MPAQEIVSLYLRAQNLEQVRRVDEAVELYEKAVEARFDAAGPYDRLIAIYLRREEHDGVARVAEAALECVRTFDEKKNWYTSVRNDARAAREAGRDRRGAEF